MFEGELYCNFIGSNGKVSSIQIQSILDKCGIPHNCAKPIFKVLCQFGLAVPLDNDMLLLPSTLQNGPQNNLYSTVEYTFPGVVVSTPKDVSSVVNDLCPTGMCYRRLFVANKIPEKFWFKLVSHFASSTKMFYNILNNYVNLERMSNTGDHQCKCLYWKNGVIFYFGDKVMFCINGLVQHGDKTRAATSVTLEKISNMKLVDVNEQKQLFPKDGDGVEVNVPDYVLWSNRKAHSFCKLGPKILAQVLEIFNEVYITLLGGDLDKGIYSQSYFKQVVVCPYCYGDSPMCVADSPTNETIEPEEATLGSVYARVICSIDYVYVETEYQNVGGYGFDIQICILEAQRHGFIYCPNHGELKLLDLTPDLVSLNLYTAIVGICT